MTLPDSKQIHVWNIAILLEYNDIWTAQRETPKTVTHAELNICCINAEAIPGWMDCVRCRKLDSSNGQATSGEFKIRF